jgi:hypothetical protein
MNLQVLALQAHVRSGAEYTNEPIVDNVLYDVKILASETDEKISQLSRRIHNYRGHLRKLSHIRVRESHRYEDVADEISHVLFDVIDYSRITTRQQIEWKEYFHGLYEMVIVPYHEDHTYRIQMIHEIYKYFDILKEPPRLEPTDPLYVDVSHCRDLFERLKREHHSMKIPNFVKKLKKLVDLQIEKRCRLVKMNEDFRRLQHLRRDCTEMLEWSGVVTQL